ncbi:MAG: hypothetical protein KGZ43_08800 [Sulfuritalea sp.]|nr:hypothetical protein [Sulfuritalea sp.]
MEIPSTRFDMTNPFAQVRQQMNHAETVLRQLPPAQRAQLLAELLPPIPARRSSPAIEPAVTMVTVKADDWDGGPVVQRTASTPVLRPRRIARHIPWQWRLIVVGIRLTRIVRRAARKQVKQFNKLQRQMMRRVLPRHRPMRGARAR